jgi:hypothetical protein
MPCPLCPSRERDRIRDVSMKFSLSTFLSVHFAHRNHLNVVACM